MKKITILVTMIFLLSLLVVGAVHLERNDDIQTIKKAVKENPKFTPGKEARWFKVLVTDTLANKDKLRITLPISLVELFMRCTRGKHLSIDCEEYDIDLKKCLTELKELGPRALIEVSADGEVLKIWLE
ncbi:MAG: hypothetical protein JXB23_12620 [Candidatus Aminicenantes bacterium]|nr:hypothetical protein [Candidatus Aminicenantes bacterium]